MHCKKELVLATAIQAVLSILLSGLVLAGLAGTGANAYPEASTDTPVPNDSTANEPVRRISGVIAIPPEQMMGRNAPSRPGEPLTIPTFGPNVDASLNDSFDQNETTVAINPENDQQVIASANDYRLALQPMVYRSTDGGTSWVNYQVPGTTGLYYGDPAMAFGRGGHAYFTYLGYQGSLCGGLGGMYVSRSTDAGASFSAPTQLAPNTAGGAIAVLQDKEYVAVDANPASPYFGNVYVGWTKYSFRAGASCGSGSSMLSAPAVLSRSTDHGLSWSVPITASPPVSDFVGGVVPAVGRKGEVYLYYVGAATATQPNSDSVLFSRSTDGGQTFPHFTHISDLDDLPNPLPPTNFRNNPYGAIAADQQIDGYIYAVWADYRNNDADILLSRSTDNGDTWSPPQRVNDDPVANGKDQFFPWIATSPDGRVHVTWFDRREDSANRSYKAYYASSSDHGQTWEPNVAVSSAPSDPGTDTFIGDYSGIAASGGVVIPIWTDIRAGSNQNAFVARGVYSIGPTATATETPPIAPTSTHTPTPTPPKSTPTFVVTSTAVSTNTPSPSPQPPTPSGTRTVTPSPTQCALSFTDLPPADPFREFVRCLACRGVLAGYADNTFRPYNPITRGQIAKVVSQAAGYSDDVTGRNTYADVPPDHTFWTWIERLTVHKVIGGYACGGPGEPCDGQNRPYFRAFGEATRGQLAKVVAIAAKVKGDPAGQTFADVPTSHPFFLWIEQLAALEVISGYNCGGPGEPCDEQNRPYFRPYNGVTRGQAAKIVANTFYPGCQTP